MKTRGTLVSRVVARVAAASTIVATFAAAGVVVNAVPAVVAGAAVAQGTTTQIPYSADLSTAGQAMFGAGAASAPSDISTTLFDKSFSGSAGFDQVYNPSVNPCSDATFGTTSCRISAGYYGANFTATASGQLGMSMVTHGTTGGSVGVNYPFSMKITAPAQDSFAPGDTVKIATSDPSVTNAAITSTYPTFSSIELDGTFGFHASASGEICTYSCTSGTILSMDIPSVGSATGPILDLTANDLLLVQGLGLAKCFGLAEGLLFGAKTYPNAGNFCEDPLTHQDHGYIAFPNVHLGGTSVGAGGTLSASGSDQYVVLPISAVKWAAKIAGMPTGFPNLSASFDGIGVAYTTIDEILSAVLAENQAYTFSPHVDVALNFGQSVSYRVTDPSDTVVSSGVGAVATVPLGDTVAVTVPGPLSVTPTVFMASNSFSNHTYDTVAGSVQVQALSVSMGLPGASYDGFSVFGGLSVNLGPVYDSGVLPLGNTSFDIYHQSWQLGGFSTDTLAPFPLSPDPLPIASALSVNPVEGAAFSGTVATFVDPDPNAANNVAAGDYTATINWGDGTSSTSGVLVGEDANFQVQGTHTYAEEGTYHVAVRVQDDQITNVNATADSTAVVADAALSGQPVENQTLNGGGTALLWHGSDSGTLATFTDADPLGTVSDYSASIDWGDGTTSSGTVGVGVNGFTVSGGHAFSDNHLGEHTISVTVRDVGGATTTVTVPLLIYTYPTSGVFAIGSAVASSSSTTRITYWSGEWAKKNGLEHSAPTSFKGFVATSPSLPAPPATLPPLDPWSSSVGNSSVPPSSVPTYMALLVTSAVSRAGVGVVAGDSVAWVIVRTNGGYGTGPGRVGTGYIVATLG